MLPGVLLFSRKSTSIISVEDAASAREMGDRKPASETNFSARVCAQEVMIHDYGKRGQKLLGGVFGVLSHANLSDELVRDAPVDATNIAHQFVTQVCTFGR